MRCSRAILTLPLALLALAMPSRAQSAAPASFDPIAALAAYNVAWDSPSLDWNGTMPLGNGAIGLNVWWEPDGDLRFLVATTDAWDELGRLVKVAQYRVHLEPNPVQAGVPFRQTLDLARGQIRFDLGQGDQATTVCVWVDAHHPRVVVEVESQAPRALRVTMEPWRNAPRPIDYTPTPGAYFGDPAWLAGIAAVNKPDTRLEPGGLPASSIPEDAWIGVVHENGNTEWFERTMALQGLEGAGMADPLEGRIFGSLATLAGGAGRRLDSTTLEAPAAARHAMTVQVGTRQGGTTGDWLTDRAVERAAAGSDLEGSRTRHAAWWDAFWRRSWVFVESPGDETARRAAETVTRGYILQRFMTACAGRGAFPIKFNGSLFTVPYPEGWNGDPDYRRWGSGYWWQNTRLPYHASLAAGDFDHFDPLFRMYAGPVLELARYRTRHHLNQDGAFLNECCYFWGAAFNDIYGWQRPADLPAGINVEGWHRWEFTAGYELAFLMLEYHAHTGDAAFLRDRLLPFTREILTFFDTRYPTDPNGKIVIHPAQALETWWDCTNPMPEIAGLTAVTDRLLALPAGMVPDSDRALASRLRAKMPPLPTRTVNGTPALAAAERFADKRNIENPELYAVHPFRLIAVGRPGLELGIEALRLRDDRGFIGWRQDDTFMAYLGMATEARAGLVERAGRKHPASRFPGFWGPNYDWVPDQDHGAMLMSTLQAMLLQTDGPLIHVLPAWPSDWDATFRLHAPARTTVSGTVRGGRLVSLDVQPPERAADVRLPAGWEVPR